MSWPSTHPVLGVLGTDGDSPRDWLAAGQALQRVLLLACSRGLIMTSSPRKEVEAVLVDPDALRAAADDA